MKIKHNLNVTFSKDAFKPKKAYCSKCDIEMIKVQMFICPRCQQQCMGLDQAKKLDKKLIKQYLKDYKKEWKFKRKPVYFKNLLESGLLDCKTLKEMNKVIKDEMSNMQ